MKVKDFCNSSWCQYAKSSENQKKIAARFKKWTTRVKGTGILQRAMELYEFYKSPDISAKEKIMVGGALLYIVTPLDLMPDGIPLVGWLDDMGVAGFALQYVRERLEVMGDAQLMEDEIEGTSAEMAHLPEMANPGEFVLNHELPASKLGNYIDSLRSVCDELKISHADSYLNGIEERLHDTHMQSLALIGRFSSGKSTLINSLLGKQLLPTGNLPTTRSITYLVKGPKDLLCSESETGNLVVHECIDELLNRKDSVLAAAGRVTLTLKDFPFDGLTIVDTPGLSDVDESNSQKTKDIISDCDAIVVLLDAAYLQSKEDLDFVQQLYHSGNKRKLFFVLNKVDKLNSPQEELEARKACEAELIRRGISYDKVHLVSAKLENAGFCNFRQELFNFLSDNFRAAVYQHTEAELSAYARSIQDSCTGAIELAALSAEVRRRVRAECEQLYQKKRKEFDKGLEKLRRQFDGYVARFFLDFTTFIDQLKGQVSDKIMTSDLSTLRNTNVISAMILERIREFIDKRVAEFADKFQQEVVAAQTEIVRSLSSIHLPLEMKYVDVRSLGKIIIPATLLLTYLTGGLFPLMKAALVVCIGREALETVIDGVISVVCDGKVREKLSASINVQLDQCKTELENILQNQFEHMFNAIEDSLREGTLGNASANLLTDMSTEEQLNKIKACRSRLGNLISNN